MSGNDAAPRATASVGPLDWAGLVLICLCAALAAVLEALLVPLYAGSVPIPVSIVFALGGNIALPLLARTLVPNLLGTALPFVVWLVVMIGFGIIARPEGDVILPGGSEQWISYAVMLGGAITGTITVVVAAPQRAPRTR